MPWVGAIWILIFLVRLLTSEGAINGAGSTGKWLSARGKVAGHRGPDMRSFRGRAGRREWWVTMLWCAVIGAFIGMVPVIGAVLAIPWTVGTLAVTARRLHDLTMSAWLQTIPMLIAAILLAGYGFGTFVLNIQFQEMVVTGGIAVIALSYGVLYLLMGFVPGARGSNCYGEADAVA